MSGHHAHASAALAQRLLDEMPGPERAQVQAEADAKGVSAVEIVRRSLDILIAESGRAPSGPAPGGPTPGSLPQGKPRA